MVSVARRAVSCSKDSYNTNGLAEVRRVRTSDVVELIAYAVESEDSLLRAGFLDNDLTSCTLGERNEGGVYRRALVRSRVVGRRLN